MLIKKYKSSINLIVSLLQHVNKKVKNFQMSKEASFDLDDNQVSSCGVLYNEQCTHVLIFEQMDDNAEHRLRSFLCKRVCKGKKCLKVLHNLYFSIYDNSLMCQQQYINSLLHTLACVLHDCLRGSAFPCVLAHWLAAKIVKLECVVMMRLKPGCMWLFGKDTNHWSYKYILSKIHLGQRFDRLATYLSFCRDTFSTHIFRGTKRPRERFTILSKCSHKEVFL